MAARTLLNIWPQIYFLKISDYSVVNRIRTGRAVRDVGRDVCGQWDESLGRRATVVRIACGDSLFCNSQWSW